VLKDTRIIIKLGMYKELDIVAEIKIKILDLIRHTVNMDHERAGKTLFGSNPVGGRRMGRPRLRWLERKLG
jgi:hypothetical protein